MTFLRQHREGQNLVCPLHSYHGITCIERGILSAGFQPFSVKPLSCAQLHKLIRPCEAPAEPCLANSQILGLKSTMIWDLNLAKVLRAFQIR